jgi:hypothetical protein
MTLSFGGVLCVAVAACLAMMLIGAIVDARRNRVVARSDDLATCLTEGVHDWLRRETSGPANGEVRRPAPNASPRDRRN